MKNILTQKSSLVAMSVTAALLLAPISASANHQNTKSRKNDAGAQIAGGLIGGSVGAILGEEIAGRGNRTEGAIIGAVIGGVTGAVIGEAAVKNNSNKRGIKTSPNRGYSHNRGFNNHRFNNRGFNNRSFGRSGFSSRRSFAQPIAFNGGSRFNSGFTSSARGHGFGQSIAASTYTRIDKIDLRVKALKHEQADIYAKLKYKGHDPYLKTRLSQIDYELADLKERRIFLSKKRNKIRKAHYHGSDACYYVH